MFEKRKIDWVATLFIFAVHGLAVWGVFHWVNHFSWKTTILTATWFVSCGFSITAGYHRLFTHRSYTAAYPLRVFFMLFGAGSSQGSAIQWVSNHFQHHASDTRKDIEDPHDIRKGFWWAHCIWLLHKLPNIRPSYVRTLHGDPLVVLQHRFYLPLMLVFTFFLPAMIALCWKDFLGGLLLAGCLRTVVQWHITWSVNSIAHTFGDNLFRRPDQSRNNWVLSSLLFALGELFHSFHHQFPSDYRNGWKCFHVDPTKWLIWTFSLIGLTKNLVRTSEEATQAAIQAAQSQDPP